MKFFHVTVKKEASTKVYYLYHDSKIKFFFESESVQLKKSLSSIKQYIIYVLALQKIILFLFSSLR